MTRRPLPVFVLAVALASTLSAIGTAGPACAENSALPPALFASNPEELAVDWIDHFR